MENYKPINPIFDFKPNIIDNKLKQHYSKRLKSYTEMCLETSFKTEEPTKETLEAVNQAVNKIDVKEKLKELMNNEFNDLLAQLDIK